MRRYVALPNDEEPMDVTCPHCAMVMTEDEAVAGFCPGCQRRLPHSSRIFVAELVEPAEIASKLIVDDNMSSLARRMSKGPSRRDHGSYSRRLAWGAVAISVLPWAIAAIAIGRNGLPESLDELAIERSLNALVAAVITVIAGLIASVMAEKEDQATRQIASVAVVLASFTILIAGAVLAKAMP